MSEAALESIYLDSHVPGWVEGRVRFGFKQIKPAIVALGDDTGAMILASSTRAGLRTTPGHQSRRAATPLPR